LTKKKTFVVVVFIGGKEREREASFSPNKLSKRSVVDISNRYSAEARMEIEIILEK